MNHSMFINRIDYDSFFKVKNVERLIISGNTRDEMFQNYFKYNNRYKYCNTVQISIEDKKDADEYRVWISKINNYAKAGGDMW